MSKVIDFLEGEINKNDLFIFTQDVDDSNLIWAIVKETNKAFAVFYVDQIAKVIEWQEANKE